MSALPSEAARLDSLRAYQVLDTPAEERFDALTRLAAYVCKTPTALVTFIDEERQWFKSRHGFATEQTERSIAFCAHVVEDREVLVVNDTHQDPRLRRTRSSPGRRSSGSTPVHLCSCPAATCSAHSR